MAKKWKTFVEKTGLEREELPWSKASRLLRVFRLVICLFVGMVLSLGIQKILFENTVQFTPYLTVAALLVFVCVALGKLEWGKRGLWILFFTALALRVFMVLFYKITPVSDFWTTLDIAQSLSYAPLGQWPQVMAQAGGIYFNEWGVHVPFILLEALFLKLFMHNSVSIQLGFALCSAVSCVLTYKIAQVLFGPRTGRTAGILMAVNPILLFFTPVLSNQHTATMFFLLAVYFVVAKPMKKQVWNGAFAGLSIGFSQLIRPEMAVFHLVLICYWVYQGAAVLCQRQDLGFHIRQGVARFLIYLCAFCLVVGGSDLFLRASHLIDGTILNGNLTYKVMVGLNYENSGIWNEADANVKQPQEMKERIYQRLSCPDEVIDLVLRKLGNQFGSYNYGWAEQDAKGALTDRIFPKLTQFFMLLVLAGALAGVAQLMKKSSGRQVLLLLILAGFFAAFAVIEVQDRYNYLLIPVFVTLAAKPMGQLYDSFAGWLSAPKKKERGRD